MSEDLSIGELDERWFIKKCSTNGIQEPSEKALGVFLEYICYLQSKKSSLEELREAAFRLTLKFFISKPKKPLLVQSQNEQLKRS